MGDFLGWARPPHPPLTGLDQNMAGIVGRVLQDHGLRGRPRDPASWPAPMRAEYGSDGGTASAAGHRDALLHHFRKARKILDDFRPDVVVIWGDAQHENFTEDVIPPFCVLAYDRIEAKHRPRDAGHNVWDEGPDTVFRIPGHREAGKFLARRLLEQDIDVSYAYKPLHHPRLAHAFLNPVISLDYDRVVGPFPVVPFQATCYGRRVVARGAFRG